VLATVPAGTGAGELKSWKGGATPALALPDVSGTRIDLGDLRGKVVLVNFWATWCPPCRAEMASIELLKEAFAGQPLEVLAVNYGESREKVAAFVKRTSLGLPVLLDSESRVAAAWGVKGLPMSFLIDARGRIRYWLFGEREWNDAESRRVVGELLAESAPGKGRR
jgi:thiol-disulfide isomerase/thioredoxin